VTLRLMSLRPASIGNGGRANDGVLPVAAAPHSSVDVAAAYPPRACRRGRHDRSAILNSPNVTSRLAVRSALVCPDSEMLATEASLRKASHLGW